MNEYKFQEVTARLKLEDAGKLFSEVPIDKPWVAVDVLKTIYARTRPRRGSSCKSRYA